MLPVLCLMGTWCYNANESGEDLADLAIDPELRELCKYFSRKHFVSSTKDSYNESKQEDLWKWTIHEIAREGEGFEKRG